MDRCIRIAVFTVFLTMLSIGYAEVFEEEEMIQEEGSLNDNDDEEETTKKEKCCSSKENDEANTEEEQNVIYEHFMSFIDSLENVTLYHFGSYEKEFIRRIQKAIPENKYDSLEKLNSYTVNLLSLVYSHVYFPTWSNSLKEIAQFLGHQWVDKEMDGLKSVVLRKRWEYSSDLSLKKQLLRLKKQWLYCNLQKYMFVAFLK